MKKGEKVRLLYDSRSQVYVVNENKQYGYIPSTVLPQKPVTDLISRRNSPRISRHSSASPTILSHHVTVSPLLRRRVSTASIGSFKDTASESSDSSSLLSVQNGVQPVEVIRSEVCVADEIGVQDSEPIVRPDTPPLVAQLEALTVHLSEDRNELMEEKEPTTKQGRDRKRKIKRRDLQLDLETRSLSKSLHHDLERLKPDDEITPTLFQRLKSFIIRRPKTSHHQRKDSASLVSYSYVSSRKLSSQESSMADAHHDRQSIHDETFYSAEELRLSEMLNSPMTIV